MAENAEVKRVLEVFNAKIIGVTENGTS
jgi:hypothetical protein